MIESSKQLKWYISYYLYSGHCLCSSTKFHNTSSKDLLLDISLQLLWVLVLREWDLFSFSIYFAN